MWDLTQSEVRNEAGESSDPKGPYQECFKFILRAMRSHWQLLKKRVMESLLPSGCSVYKGWAHRCLNSHRRGRVPKSSLGRNINQETKGFWGRQRREHEATSSGVFQPQTTELTPAPIPPSGFVMILSRRSTGHNASYSICSVSYWTKALTHDSSGPLNTVIPIFWDSESRGVSVWFHCFQAIPSWICPNIKI